MEVLNHWSEQKGDAGKIATTLGDWSDTFLDAISPKTAPSLHLKNEEEVDKILDKLEELKEDHVADFVSFLFSISQASSADPKLCENAV